MVEQTFPLSCRRKCATGFVSACSILKLEETQALAKPVALKASGYLPL